MGQPRAKSCDGHPQRVCASAGITVGNQPSFDRGGIAFRAQEIIAGSLAPWETLRDTVTIDATPSPLDIPQITISSSTQEPFVPPLPSVPEENMAGRAVCSALSILATDGYRLPWDIHVTVKKGISLKGTGLGSSGASAAAALKACERLLTELHCDRTFTAPERNRILQEADCGVPDNSIAAYWGGWTTFVDANPSNIAAIVPPEAFGVFVLTCPRGFGISTIEARKVVPASPPKDHEHTIAAMLRAVEQGNTAAYGALMERAHAWFVTPRITLYPKNGAFYRSIADACHRTGAAGVTIAGAGPSIIAVTERKLAVAVGQAAVAACQEHGYEALSFIAAIDTEGATLIPPSPHAVR